MDMSLELLNILTTSQHDGYRNIITGDQSWFVYNYPPKGSWVLNDEKPPVFENPNFSVEKMMITVIWGVYGTYIFDDLPEGEHYNSTYFIEHVLRPLEEQKDQIWPTRGKHKIWLHLDNCKVHNSKATQKEMELSTFKRAPYPPYSPDLAPSDFFLFGTVKEKLRGRSFQTREQLFEAILQKINEISPTKRIEVLTHGQIVVSGSI